MSVFPSPMDCMNFAAEAFYTACFGIPLVLFYAFGWLMSSTVVVAVYPFVLSYNISYLILPFWTSLIFGLAGGIVLWVVAGFLVFLLMDSLK
jgi:hypothetical protein